MARACSPSSRGSPARNATSSAKRREGVAVRRPVPLPPSPPRWGRCVLEERALLELRLDLDAPGAGVVDEAGEVVEVDRPFQGDVVGDVAAEDRHLPRIARRAVADPDPALE